MGNSFQFSKDDVEALRARLTKFDSRHVDEFIAGLQILCGIASRLTDLKSLADHRGKLRSIQKNIKKTLDDLERISSRKFNILPQTTFDHVKGEEAARRMTASIDSVNIVVEAYQPLENLSN
jgi:hypothetical protein